MHQQNITDNSFESIPSLDDILTDAYSRCPAVNAGKSPPNEKNPREKEL